VGVGREETIINWTFLAFFTSGKSTCHFQGNYALLGDIIREVIWTLCFYCGCNKRGTTVFGSLPLCGFAIWNFQSPNNPPTVTSTNVASISSSQLPHLHAWVHKIQLPICTRVHQLHSRVYHPTSCPIHDGSILIGNDTSMLGIHKTGFIARFFQWTQLRWETQYNILQRYWRVPNLIFPRFMLVTLVLILVRLPL
jgi:hypothetical protein